MTSNAWPWQGHVRPHRPTSGGPAETGPGGPSTTPDVVAIGDDPTIPSGLRPLHPLPRFRAAEDGPGDRATSLGWWTGSATSTWTVGTDASGALASGRHGVDFPPQTFFIAADGRVTGHRFGALDASEHDAWPGRLAATACPSA